MIVFKAIKHWFARRKVTRRNRALGTDIALIIVLGIFGLFSLIPLWFIIINAFKPLNEIFIFPPKFYVINPTLKNFKDLFTLIGNTSIPFSRYIFNTLFMTVLGTFGAVIVSSMAAFPLAKYRFPGQAFMSSMIVYALMFNGAVTAIPNYIIMTYLGLVDSYWAIIIPGLGSTLGLYLLKNNMIYIPDSLIESAKMDGASEWKVYWSIVMPLSKPAWITLIIFSFQGFWGNDGSTFLYTEKLKPLTYALGQITAAGIVRTGVSSAISLIMLAVPVAVFIISQSNVIETMAASGLKE